MVIFYYIFVSMVILLPVWVIILFKIHQIEMKKRNEKYDLNKINNK